MCHWYSVRVFRYLGRLGYTHVMRMDDNSMIHSAIDEDLFSYMKHRGLRYGYRMGVNGVSMVCQCHASGVSMVCQCQVIGYA